MPTAAPKRTSDKTSTRAGRTSTANGRDSDAVRELFVHTTRVQLATLTSLSKLVLGWAQSADRYAQAISDEVLGRAAAETAPCELVGRLAVVSNRHLHELTGLPTEAVNHFNSELANRPEQRQPARRRAA